MVRNYKGKDKYGKWKEEDMEKAINSVIDGLHSVRGASQTYSVPYATLHGRIRAYKAHDKQGRTLHKKKASGHPSLLKKEEEKQLVERLISFSRRGFGCTPDLVRRAVFQYAEETHIKHPWKKEEGKAGPDWFSAFMKRHPELSLRKPENLSRARAEGLTQKAVGGFFDLCEEVYRENEMMNQPNLVFNMDETGFPLNNKPSRIVSEKGTKEVVALTSVERGENVTVIACCSASGAYIPPMVIFKGIRHRPEYVENMPPGTIVTMSETGYINEELFLTWLQHFQRHRPRGKCILILDGHASHHSLPCLEYCSENKIELLCLPPHTTHVLQPLDRAVFKPLKTFYNQSATMYIRNHPSNSITKLNFGKIFNEAWNKTATVGNAVKGFQCTGIFPLNPNIIPKEKFLPSKFFDSGDAQAESDLTFDISIQNLPPLLNDPLPNVTDINSPGPSQIGQSNEGAQTSIFACSIPTPKRVKKRMNCRLRQKAKILTSPENIATTAAKRKLKMENNEKNCRNTKRKFENGKKGSDGHDSSESTKDSCGFCGLGYYSKDSIKKGDWIKCQKCSAWYHEICVGAMGKKQFLCGKCI